MIRETERTFMTPWITLLCLWLCFCCSGTAFGEEIFPAPTMPSTWKVVSDFQVPAGQVGKMSTQLGADLSGVRNTVYDVGGKRIQLNTIVTPDAENAARLMTKLRSMKAEVALLQKGLTVYEFVGPNDVLPIIAEGHNYLETN